MMTVMFSKKTSILVAAAVLLLQSSDCMASLAPDQNTMQCCATMKCPMEHMSAGCCTTTVSAQAPSSLPTSKTIVKAPVLGILFHAVGIDPVGTLTLPPTLVKSRQHSPPDLYTLHHSFLI
jgi:hypothetical protein